MKTVIRRGVFETNSSSVHVMTICSKQEYDDFYKGKRVMYKNKLFTQDELAEYKKDVLFQGGYFWDKDVMTLSDFEKKGEEFDWFEKEYTTKSGDEIIAFGYSGWDG